MKYYWILFKLYISRPKSSGNQNIKSKNKFMIILNKSNANNNRRYAFLIINKFFYPSMFIEE